MAATQNGTSLPGPPPLTLSTLCLACKSVFEGSTIRNQEGEVPHHDIDALGSRASRGCQLCLTVYMSIDPDAIKSLRQSAASPVSPTSPNGANQPAYGFVSITPIARDQARLKFRYSKPEPDARDGTASPESERDAKGKSIVRPGASTVLSNRSTTSLLSNGRVSPTSGRPQSVIVELILMNPRYAVEPGVRNISTQSTSTASEESFHIARAWLDECSFNHMKCSVNTNVVIDIGFDSGLEGNTWKPTHLLDISIKGPKGAQGVKLVDGMFVDPLSEYVTLSHVWGKTKGVRLHKGTLPALRQGVAASSLPKTYADAAMVVQSLGFRYLWIDALCIMHDSEKDVLNEIGQMDKVYGEAVLNIAATGAKDDAQGLVAERNAMALQPCVVSVQGVGIEDGLYKCLRSTVWQDLVDCSPLAKRAWVLQERAVAKRTLHFTRNELLWECQQMCCSEVFPKGLPATMKGGGDGDLDTTFDKRVHHQRHGNWRSLVKLYTKGRLSYSGDKLMALEALARQYMQRNRLRSADYICGMWRSMLPQGLLWKVESGVRPKKWRAPSWAWASIEGEVTCPDTTQASKESCLEVMDVELKPKGDDPFGQIESGRLKVRGFMARGLLRRTHDYWGQGPCVIDCINAQLEIEAANFDERLPKLSAVGGRGLAESVQIYLLPVIDTVDRVEGLILCSNLKKGEFRRLGCFEVSRYDQVNWDRFRSIMKGDPEMNNYEERLDHRNGFWFASDYTYTINLV